MKKMVLGAVIAAFILSAVPAKAETIFNDASKCIASWKASCCVKGTGEKAAPAKSAEGKSACQMCTTDALGNKIPTGTVK